MQKWTVDRSKEVVRLYRVFVTPPPSPPSSSQVTVERVRGDLKDFGEDSDLDLPDKRVHSHGRKGESRLLLISPLLDSQKRGVVLKAKSSENFPCVCASLEFIRGGVCSKTDL